MHIYVLTKGAGCQLHHDTMNVARAGDVFRENMITLHEDCIYVRDHRGMHAGYVRKDGQGEHWIYRFNHEER